MTDKSATERLREMLDERGVKWTDKAEEVGLTLAGFADTRWNANGVMWLYVESNGTTTLASSRPVEIRGYTPEQAIAATLGRPKAKAHPYGYEPDTGAFDCTRCECGCINDISATYCNDCGGEIEIDMYAEKEIYHTLRHLVFAEKHDDGSLEFGGKRYVAATLRSGKLTADDVLNAVYKHGARWQAIADELNSRADYHGYEQAAIEAWESIKVWNSRAERTCEWELEHSGTLYDKWRCSKCGYLFVESRCDQGYTDLEPNYCPNCGRKCI